MKLFKSKDLVEKAHSIALYLLPARCLETCLGSSQSEIKMSKIIMLYRVTIFHDIRRVFLFIFVEVY